jgi:putative RNA 2'-phosphotransferase
VLAALERALARPLPLHELEAVVRESAKQRFALVDGRIRANQGHSIPLDLDFASVSPPPVLYHGTTRERWQKIRASGGLKRMQRHHVHLSSDIAAARRVAARHRGELPLILSVSAEKMAISGHEFYRSENGVFLTDQVPLQYLSELPDQE